MTRPSMKVVSASFMARHRREVFELASQGPVGITQRRVLSFVIMSIDEYERLSRLKPTDQTDN